MAIKFKDFLAYTVHATDGDIGKISDVLFDDRSWSVRYIVLDTSKWLPGKKVLLAPESFLKTNSIVDGALRVNLTKAQVKDSPPLESDLPVSRQYEVSLHSYFGWDPYWTGPTGNLGFPYPDATLARSDSYTMLHADWEKFAETRQKKFNAHLRSLHDIMGYKISTKDYDLFGEVSDAVVDTKDWLVIDLVLSSHRWLPGGKHFVCSPMFVDDIDETEKVLGVVQLKEILLESPEFNFATYGESYRKSLVKHYLNFDAGINSKSSDLGDSEFAKSS
ncbi:MAG: PRC-barrel domain-containing protein [Oligoflexales bacterium]